MDLSSKAVFTFYAGAMMQQPLRWGLRWCLVTPSFICQLLKEEGDLLVLFLDLILSIALAP